MARWRIGCLEYMPQYVRGDRVELDRWEEARVPETLDLADGERVLNIETVSRGSGPPGIRVWLISPDTPAWPRREED